MTTRTSYQFAGITSLLLAAAAILTYVVAGRGAFLFSMLHAVASLACLALFLFGTISQKGERSQQEDEYDTSLRAKARSHRFSGIAVLLTLILALIAVNIGIYRYAEQTGLRWDSTEKQVQSLSPELKELFALVPEPLTLYIVGAFSGRDVAKQRLFLHQLERLGRHEIQVKQLDPRHDMVRINELKLPSGARAAIVHNSQEGSESVRALFTLNEEALFKGTRALVFPQRQRVYVVQGHGEPALDSVAEAGLSRFKAAALEEGVELVPYLSLGQRQVPEDADAVMVVAPSQALQGGELAMLRRYAESGGNLILFHDPEASESVVDLARYFDIKVEKRVVVSAQRESYGSEESTSLEPSDTPWQLPLVSFGQHPLTATLPASGTAVFLYAAPVKPLKKDSAEERFFQMALTSEYSWSEDITRMNSAGGVSFDQAEDVKGPFSLGVIKEVRPATKESSKKAGRVVVWGDAEWISNVNFNVFENRALAVLSTQWASSSASQVQLPSKQWRQSLMPMSARTHSLVLSISFLFPELLLLFGMALWWQRRARSVYQREVVCQ